MDASMLTRFTFMDASMLTRFMFYDLQSIIEPILHPMDASTLLDSCSMIHNQLSNLFHMI